MKRPRPTNPSRSRRRRPHQKKQTTVAIHTVFRRPQVNRMIQSARRTTTSVEKNGFGGGRRLRPCWRAGEVIISHKAFTTKTIQTTKTRTSFSKRLGFDNRRQPRPRPINIRTSRLSPFKKYSNKPSKRNRRAATKTWILAKRVGSMGTL